MQIWFCAGWVEGREREGAAELLSAANRMCDGYCKIGARALHGLLTGALRMSEEQNNTAGVLISP